MTPIHSASIITETSLALAFWSWIPLYALPITLCACILKVPIEVCDLRQRPRRSRALMSECSRKERLSKIRSLVNNTRHTSSGSHMGSFRTSGESRLGIADTNQIKP